ncbi:MAG: hypothetical protein KA794_21285, partial [Candidatus Obscuribacter sp.]|nr:hypothetical protein [Candidatus Obscuribacter sp.]
MDNSQNEEVMTLAPVGKLRWKRMMQVVSDALLASLSLSFAYVIRFDGHIQQQYLHQLWLVVPPLVALRLISNWRCGLYGRLWRYTGLTEVAEIGVAVLNISALMLILRALSLPFLRIEGQQLSYSIIVIDMMLCFFLMTACRVLRRLQTEHAQRKHWRQPVRRRALVVGAGDAGLMVLKELNQRSDLGVDVV